MKPYFFYRTTFSSGHQYLPFKLVMKGRLCLVQQRKGRVGGRQARYWQDPSERDSLRGYTTSSFYV